MLGWVVLAFIVLPFVELWLLIEIGQRIGFWETFAIVIATGLVGGILARYQGGQAWRAIFRAAREGRVPRRELVAGALFLFGAALLLTPGVLTDAFGLAMMVPAIREALAGWLIGRFRRSDRVQTFTGFGRPQGTRGWGAEGRSTSQGYDVDVEGYAKPDDEDELEESDDEPGPTRSP